MQIADLMGIVTPASAQTGPGDAPMALSILGGFVLLSLLYPWASQRLLSPWTLLYESLFAALPPKRGPASQNRGLDPTQRTAVLLVSGYNEFGLQGLLALWRVFPEEFPQIVFVGVGPLEAAALGSYRSAARAMGMEAGFRRMDGPDFIAQAERTCLRLTESFPSVVFCSGRLLLRPERWWQRFLPDEACEAVRKRLHRRGLTTVSLTVRPEMKKAATRAAAFPG